MAGVRAADHDEKRGLILQTAVEMFAKQGFHKTSISEIATRCGATSKAWIYHYFENKEAILFTLIHDFMSLVSKRVLAAIEPFPDPAQRLRVFIRESLAIYVEYRINYPKLFSEMTCLGKSEQDEIKKIQRHFAIAMRDILIELNPNIAKKPHEAMALTLLVFGTVNWSYTWFDNSGPLTLDSVSELTEKLLLNGLASF